MRVLTILVLPLLLWGCLSANPYDPVPRVLWETHKSFEDIVRWRALYKMYSFGKPGNDWEVQEDLDNVRVNGYEAGGLSEIAPWRWGQSVSISYVLVDRQVVKQVLDQQIWVSENEGKTWYRENPPPRFD